MAKIAPDGRLDLEGETMEHKILKSNLTTELADESFHKSNRNNEPFAEELALSS